MTERRFCAVFSYYSTYYHVVYIIFLFFLIFYFHNWNTLVCPCRSRREPTGSMEELFVVEAFQDELAYSQNPQTPDNHVREHSRRDQKRIWSDIVQKGKVGSENVDYVCDHISILFKMSLPKYLQAMRYIQYVFISILRVKKI